MLYLISYDLNKSGQNYKGLYEAIKSFGTYARPVESVWLIETQDNAAQILKRLKPHIDDNDSLLIIQAGRDWSGWLPKNFWDWLNNRKAA